jgi:hypothetical protein
MRLFPTISGALRAFAASIAAPTLAALIAATPARADITDEIQVYTDEINEPGETGLELHVNTTPSGRSTPGYPGEVTPAHGWRVTPEFSYGLSRDWELGAYLPTVMRSGGQYDVAGAKVRLKWLPVRGGEGFFYGVNAELSRMARKYSESRTTAELRFIGGWRSGPWLLAVNPMLDFGLSDGERLRNPDTQLGMKASREIWQGVSLGSEYYWTPGKIDDIQAMGRSPNTLFAVADIDLKPYVFNVGIGRGTSSSADRWTVKAIFEIPF